jgi:hypothetical protein
MPATKNAKKNAIVRRLSLLKNIPANNRTTRRMYSDKTDNSPAIALPANRPIMNGRERLFIVFLK